MSLERVAEVLRRRIGLDAASLGPSALTRALQQRLRELRLEDAREYAPRLESDPMELQALINAVNVCETWFYRNDAALQALARRALELAGRRTVRALSIPCSTGEEPYSLALLLAELGAWARALPIAIVGVDIASDCIRRAERGTYREFTFRQTDPGVRQRYFRPGPPGEWELVPEIRGRVGFRVGNLLEPGFLADEAPFDLILCRNLFIYLTPDAQQQALATLERLLAPEGWLAVSPAEATRLPPERFRPVGLESLLVFERGTRELANPAPALPLPLPRPALPSATSPRLAAPAPPSPPAASAPAHRPESAEDRLREARKLADAGQLAPALALCQQLGRVRPSAELYSLIGVIQEAQGHLELAAQSFRSALYLDARCAEALEHLAILCERRGDTRQADVHRQRLARLTCGGAS